MQKRTVYLKSAFNSFLFYNIRILFLLYLLHPILIAAIAAASEEANKEDTSSVSEDLRQIKTAIEVQIPQEATYDKSVVQLNVVQQEYDYTTPWKKTDMSRTTDLS